MLHRVYINIGSNSGHRHALIERAVTAVSLALGGVVSRSDIIETEPWGFSSPNPFLNVGLMVELEGGDNSMSFAETVFESLSRVEKDIDPSPHRDSSGGYIDRAIDIDLIAVDSLVMTTERLTLPHPQMHRRGFVLGPMMQLDSGWRHPLLGKTVAEMLGELKDS